jgi:hypothetical protein
MATNKNQPDSAKALLALGKRVAKALRDSDPEVVDLLDEYTEAFDIWRGSWARGGKQLSARDREVGERIAEQHAGVIELTESMLQTVEQSLKDLRGWSKGIRAYMDHFPKQVSTMRTRKG